MQKTIPLSDVVSDYLATLNELTRIDALHLCQLFTEETHEEPVLWRGNMIGFGTYHYKYASGHEGFAMKCGFAIRKTNITLYLYTETDNKNPNRNDQLLNELGKFKHGKWCIYIKSLRDIDLDVLKRLIRRNLEFIEVNATTVSMS